MIGTKQNTMTGLAAAIALCVAPALAFAGDQSMGSQASDAYNEGQVWATYVANPALETYGLTIDVEDGKAVLTGNVESQIEKQLAERIASKADGIKSVDNRIVVNPDLGPNAVDSGSDITVDFGRYVADATIEAMVSSKLLWNAGTDGLNVSVKSRSGAVTLTGHADTDRSKRLAGWIAANTTGVVEVVNNLDVDASHRGVITAETPGDGNVTLNDEWIVAKVNASLLWAPGVDGTDIDVAASDGVVTLTGMVGSASEKQRAVELAQNIRGVGRVDVTGLEMSPGFERVSSN